MSIPDDNDHAARTGDSAPGAPLASPQPVSHPAAPTAPDSTQEERRRSVSRWLGAGLVVAVIVIVALAAALRHQQQQLDNFGREATRRLNDMSAAVEEARTQSRQAASVATGQDGRLAALDQRVQRAEDQQKALAQSYRELVSGNDEALLVDVEQSLMMAAEQLQWTGRVPSAIAALQLAEARLARAGRPGFISAQQAIGRDVNRLQAVPAPAVSDIAARIERLMTQVDSLPLAAVGTGVTPVEGTAAPVEAPVAETPEAVAPDAPWWKRAWAPVSEWSGRAREATLAELRELVNVRRIDSPDALLLAPEQGTWLRTNVRLRLTEARIALLSRHADIWRADLASAADAVRRYADPEAAATRQWLRQVEQLGEIDPAPALPDLNESLTAVRALLSRASAEALDAQTGG